MHKRKLDVFKKGAGVLLLGARYYDPQISSWISTDPALAEYLPTGKQVYFPEKAFDAKNLKGTGGAFNSLNLNLYQYAKLNPIKYIDPDGRTDEAAILLGGGIIAALTSPATLLVLGGIAVVGIGYGIYKATQDETPSMPVPDVKQESDKRVKDVLKGTTQEGKNDKVKVKTQGDRHADFDSLTRGSKVKEGEQTYKDQKGKIRTGEMPDGRKVIDRDLSKDGRGTLEIQKPNGKMETEIRYP